MKLSSIGWCVVLPEAGDKGAEFRPLFASFSKLDSIGVDLTLPLYSKWQPARSLPERSGCYSLWEREGVGMHEKRGRRQVQWNVMALNSYLVDPKQANSHTQKQNLSLKAVVVFICWLWIITCALSFK